MASCKESTAHGHSHTHLDRLTHAEGTIKFIPPWNLPQFPAKSNHASPTPEGSEDQVTTLCSLKWLWSQAESQGWAGGSPNSRLLPSLHSVQALLSGSGQAGYRAGGWSSGWSEARQTGGGGAGGGEN